MSHWTRSRIKIKNSDLFASVCKRKRLSVKQGDVTLKSTYAGEQKASMLIEDPVTGDVAGLVRDETGSLVVQMDNWGNSLAYKYGENLSDIVQEYASDLVKSEAQLMGGIVESESYLQNGDIELKISVL